MTTYSIIFISVILSLIIMLLIILIVIEILFENGKFKHHKPINENTNVKDVFDVIEQSISDEKNKYLSSANTQETELKEEKGEQDN